MCKIGSICYSGYFFVFQTIYPEACIFFQLAGEQLSFSLNQLVRWSVICQ